ILAPLPATPAPSPPFLLPTAPSAPHSIGAWRDTSTPDCPPGAHETIPVLSTRRGAPAPVCGSPYARLSSVRSRLGSGRPAQRNAVHSLRYAGIRSHVLGSLLGGRLHGRRVLYLRGGTGLAAGQPAAGDPG